MARWTWQRVAVGDIRIFAPRREAWLAFGFALFYLAAAALTGWIVLRWPRPLWGATFLTSDATYVGGFKIGLLLLVPLVAIVATAVLFTAWHLPTRYLLASGVDGTAGDLPSVLTGTGLPTLVVGLLFGWAWDRWRNLPALVAMHWGIDLLPSVASFLRIPAGAD
jgi:hypothetical protein